MFQSGGLEHWQFQLPNSINRRPVNNPGRKCIQCDLALVSKMKTIVSVNRQMFASSLKTVGVFFYFFNQNIYTILVKSNCRCSLSDVIAIATIADYANIDFLFLPPF